MGKYARNTEGFPVKPRFDKIEAHMFLDELHARLENEPGVYWKFINFLHLFHNDRYVLLNCCMDATCT